MKLIPQVRLDAGLPPLVTPTSQIVGAQAVNCAMDTKKGSAMYTNVSNQFISLVKGEYGETPIPVDPDFREKICGHKDERPFDTSTYKMQPNPVLDEFGGVKLAENEEEVLLLELFPMVAKNYLKGVKKAAWEAKQANNPATKEASSEAPKAVKKVSGKKITVPMPGRILQYLVKPGDKVEKDQPIAILEAMKMENSITSNYAGYVNSLLVDEGETVAADTAIMDIVSEPVTPSATSTTPNETAKAAQKATRPAKSITVPMPGKVLQYLVKQGDKIEKDQPVAILEAMKMENSITSNYAGYVNSLIVEEGETVAADTAIMNVVDQPVSPATSTEKAAPKAAPKATGPTKAVTVPMPGKILDIQVKPGDQVNKGQVVVILEAMKMENSISSDFAGTVNEIFVEVGDTVAADTKVLDLVQG